MTTAATMNSSSAPKAISVNSELTLMYWHIGERINKEVLHDQRAEYGKAIVSTLSAQLMELYGKDFNSSQHCSLRDNLQK